MLPFPQQTGNLGKSIYTIRHIWAEVSINNSRRSHGGKRKRTSTATWPTIARRWVRRLRPHTSSNALWYWPRLDKQVSYMLHRTWELRKFIINPPGTHGEKLQLTSTAPTANSRISARYSSHCITHNPPIPDLRQLIGTFTGISVANKKVTLGYTLWRRTQELRGIISLVVDSMSREEWPSRYIAQADDTYDLAHPSCLFLVVVLL